MQRSRFIGSARMVQTPEEARTFIAERSLMHKKATHNCWGYKTGTEKHLEIFSSDDGEPSGTAGKPIEGSIERQKITNVAVVVTRYFGGKKLGIRGLIDAYSSASEAVIRESGLYLYQLMRTIRILCGYPEWNRIEYELGKNAIYFDKEKLRFGTNVEVIIEIPEEKSGIFLPVLDRYINNGLNMSYNIEGDSRFSPVKYNV
ncbi:MAG TPA: YigZ family protein [Thermotogota bacterium]|nr:YigZ family protein [Thermotogota bacterium]HPJ87669.1 YigZ family protein [Thermotogota bacterium]